MGTVWKDRHGKPNMTPAERDAVTRRMTFNQLRLAEKATRVVVEGDVITFYGEAAGSQFRSRLHPDDDLRKVVGGAVTLEKDRSFDKEYDELIKKAES